MSIATAETPDALAAQMWDRSQVAKVFRVSTETVKRWQKEGRLPAPVQIGSRSLWPADVIRAVAGGGATR